MIQINRNPSRGDLKWFGLLLLLFFGLLGAMARWRFGHEETAGRFWWIGLGLCVLYYAIPPMRRWIFVGWMYFAFPIGWTISHLLLFLVYFLLLTPVGLLLRLSGRDPLERRLEPGAASYWSKRSAAEEPGRYFRQF